MKNDYVYNKNMESAREYFQTVYREFYQKFSTIDYLQLESMLNIPNIVNVFDSFYPKYDNLYITTTTISVYSDMYNYRSEFIKKLCNIPVLDEYFYTKKKTYDIVRTKIMNISENHTEYFINILKHLSPIKNVNRQAVKELNYYLSTILNGQTEKQKTFVSDILTKAKKCYKPEYEKILILNSGSIQPMLTLEEYYKNLIHGNISKENQKILEKSSIIFDDDIPYYK